MPYIKDSQKAKLHLEPPSTTGELNFILTKVIIDYTKRFGLKYSTINDVVGALECAKLEYIRRVVGPYEDTKIKENGDVYPAPLTRKDDKPITSLSNK